MPDAQSAVSAQPRARFRTSARRPLVYLLGVTVGLSLLVPAAAGSPETVEARAGARRCSGWHSLTEPPRTIRVLRRRTGRVEVVNFRKYVVTVMGKEWPSYLPQAVVEAGAIAVKQYGWWKTLDGRQRITKGGRCFDVRDGVSDQLYKPQRARVRGDHWRAVDKTWDVTLRKAGNFFMTGYRRGGKRACGRDATGWKLYARSATRCARRGMNWRQILDRYYGPRLDIIDGVAGSNVSSSSRRAQSGSRRAQSEQVIDDRSRAITWRGKWRRVRRSWAQGNTITYSGLTGSSARFRFVGRSLELKATRGPRRGMLKVYVNGNLKETVDLSAKLKQPQQSVFSANWRRVRARTVRLVVVAAARRAVVDLDAIIVSR